MQMSDFFFWGGEFLDFQCSADGNYCDKRRCRTEMEELQLAQKKQAKSNKSLAFYNPIQFPIFAKYKM